MTFSTPHHFFYFGGVFDLSWIGWIWNNIAPEERRRRGQPGPQTSEEARLQWRARSLDLLGRLPLASLPDFRQIAPWYYEWLQHPPWDPWWDWGELRTRYTEVSSEVAILNLSGWYDEAYGPQGAITNFQGMLPHRRHLRDPRLRLILGPWTHGVSALGQRRVGVRDFGPQAPLDYDALVLRWMDRYVRELDNGVDREKPVHYFVMGTNRWRESDRWPPDSTPRTLFLSGGRPGRLSTHPPHPGGWTRFVSDPDRPATDPHWPQVVADQRPLLARPDVLVFDTDPLQEEIEVTGHIRARIHLSTGAPDTDLWVRLLDVGPDGSALPLMSPGADVLRASYRHRRPQRDLLRPGRVYLLELENLVTSHVFAPGHRIRVQICASFFPYFSRNLHSGELETTSDRRHPAEIRIHYGGDYPSHILLPVLSPSEGK